MKTTSIKERDAVIHRPLLQQATRAGMIRVVQGHSAR